MSFAEDGGGSTVRSSQETSKQPMDMFDRNAAALAAFRRHYPNRTMLPRGTSAEQDAFLDGYIRALRDTQAKK